MIETVKFRDARIQIIILLLVFLLYLSSALGILEITSTGMGGIVVPFSSHSLSLFLFRLATLESFLFIVTGMLLVILLPVIRPLIAIIFTITLILVLTILNYFSYSGFMNIPLEYFLLMIFMLYIVNILVSYFINIHSQQKLLEVFGQYIPMEIVKQISQDKEAASLEGQAREMTVMFCDIQNFSALAEELNPKQLGKLLNEYFTDLSELIYQQHGTIDKFIGDSIMAFWGAPLKCPDHAQKSVQCALEMISEIEKLSLHFINKGWPGPKAGIGINTGLMAVGNMGSKYRMTYTVIGDAVNIASRVETLTRTYLVPIIITENTMQKADTILFRELDNVTLKGKRISSKLYEPLCIKENADKKIMEKLEKHNIALEFYYSGSFDKALEYYSDLNNTFPDDRYYQAMKERIKTKINSA